MNTIQQYKKYTRDFINSIFWKTAKVVNLNRFMQTLHTDDWQEIVKDSLVHNTRTGRITAQLHLAFERPIGQSCELIERFLQSYSIKDLHCVFPALIESIFNFDGNHDQWFLGNILYYRSFEFMAVRKLLSPHGILMQLVYRLATDHGCNYEFPLSCVPAATKCLLENGNCPSFYQDKIRVSPTGKPYDVLLLNAFEFYMFHFAYFIINPHNAKMLPQTKRTPCEWIYPMLANDYFHCFFPLTMETLPPQIFRSPEATSRSLSPGMSPEQQRFQTPGRENVINPSNFSPLLRIDPHLLAQINSYNAQCNTDVGSVEKETWASEVFLQILAEFWLNQFSEPTCEQQYLNINRMLRSDDFLYLIRTFIKHLHYFVNSADNRPVTPIWPQVLPQWDGFKKSVWSQYISKRMYIYLRHHFKQWPVDVSFRIVLETWLSFIQPWRYTADSLEEIQDSFADRVEPAVTEKWRPFVNDHLLFYTVLLQCFMERSVYSDLTASQNAQLIYRVAKVYCTKNLRQILMDGETSDMEQVDWMNHSMSQRPFSNSFGSFGTSVNLLTLKVLELEGSQYRYRPLFSLETEALVIRFLTAAATAQESARNSIQLVEQTNQGSLLTILSRLWRSGDDEYNSKTNFEKAIQFLQMSIPPLCSFFQIPESRIVVTSVRLPAHVSSRFVRDDAKDLPEVENTDGGACLTPLGRQQIISGTKKFELDYLGDPDLQPIRSFECGPLVRFLFHVCGHFNTRYAAQIRNSYNRQDYVGQLSRYIFQPPVLARNFATYPPVVRQSLESHRYPRLSLRFMARFTNIGLLVGFYLFLNLWLGVDLVPFTAGLIALVLFGCFLLRLVLFSESQM